KVLFDHTVADRLGLLLAARPLAVLGLQRSAAPLLDERVPITAVQFLHYCLLAPTALEKSPRSPFLLPTALALRGRYLTFVVVKQRLECERTFRQRLRLA